jgi:hypothetical protein
VTAASREVLLLPGARLTMALASFDVVVPAAAVFAAAASDAGALAEAVPPALAAAAAFAIFRSAAGFLGDGAARGLAPGPILRARILGIYTVLAAGAALAALFFPGVAGPEATFLFSAAHCGLLLYPDDRRARAAMDWNGAFIAALANTGNSPAARAPTALYLVLLALGLAFRHYERAARRCGRAAAGLFREPLAPGVLGGIGLAAAYVALGSAFPCSPVAAARGPAAFPVEPARPEVPWLYLLALAARAALALFFLVGAIVIARRLLRKRERPLPAPKPETIEAGLPRRLAPPPRRKGRSEPVTGLRAAVVAEYLRIEQRLARAGVPRRPCDGPAEHTALAMARFPQAAEDLRVATRIFAAARYGREEPDEADFRSIRAAALRVASALEQGP